MHLLGKEIPFYTYIIVLVVLVVLVRYVRVCTISCVDIIIHVILCRQRYSILLLLATLCLFSFFIRLVTFALQPHKSQNVQPLFMRITEIVNSSRACSQSLTFISNEPNKNLPYIFFLVWFFSPCLFPLPSIIIQIR